MLYDLTANLDGNNFPIIENGTTVVQSNTPKAAAVLISVLQVKHPMLNKLQLSSMERVKPMPLTIQTTILCSSSNYA